MMGGEIPRKISQIYLHKRHSVFLLCVSLVKKARPLAPQLSKSLHLFDKVRVLVSEEAVLPQQLNEFVGLRVPAVVVVVYDIRIDIQGLFGKPLHNPHAIKCGGPGDFCENLILHFVHPLGIAGAPAGQVGIFVKTRSDWQL